MFESTINFKIDNGADYFEASNKTPEGAIILLEDAYDTRSLEAVYELVDFRTDAEMFFKKNMPQVTADEKMINDMVEVYKLTLEKMLGAKNGWPNFQNVERAFTKKEIISPDLQIITEHLTLNGSPFGTNKLYVKKRSDETYIVAGNA